MVDLSKPLTSPVVLSDGTVLQNLSEASLWLLNCNDSEHPQVRTAARCLVDAADGGSLVVASNVLRFAAFTMGQLKVM
jgi:hypothetical protein